MKPQPMSDRDWIMNYGISSNLRRNLDRWALVEIAEQMQKAIKRGRKLARAEASVNCDTESE